MDQRDAAIAAFYALGLERDRLAVRQPLERIRIQQILGRHLPPAPATVLDIGGGAGAYAFWLAERGYQVRLVDPVPLHLEQAREQNARASSTSPTRQRRPDRSLLVEARTRGH